MEPSKFADMMEDIGFQASEAVAPTFELSKGDLKNPVFKKGYTKVVGKYRMVSIWFQCGEVAFWAEEHTSGTKLFPFHKEEVDYLAAKMKFRKN